MEFFLLMICKPVVTSQPCVNPYPAKVEKMVSS